MRPVVIALISLLVVVSAAGSAYFVMHHDPDVSDVQPATDIADTDDGTADTPSDPAPASDDDADVPSSTDPADTDTGDQDTDDQDTDGEDADDSEQNKSRELIGKYLQFELSGSTTSRSFFGQTTTNISGNVTYTYLDYNGSRDAFYMVSETSVLYTRNSQVISSNVDSNFYWTDENDNGATYTYGEQTTIIWSGKSVDVVPVTQTYTSGRSSITEVQYCGIGEDDWWVVYEIVYTSVSQGQGSSSTQITYVLSSYGDADLTSFTDLCIYTDAGITVTTEGTVAVGETVTLTAADSGTGFGGWYDTDGALLSSERSYSFDVTVGNISVVARNAQDNDLYAADYSTSVELGADADSGTWTIGDKAYDLGASVTLYPGSYSAYFVGEKNGSPVYLYRDILVDGTSVVRTYQWTYNNVDYEITLSIEMDDYNSFVNALEVSERCDSWYATKDISGDIAFVNTVSTVDDPYLQQIADYFTQKTAGMSAQQAANVVLSFVQDAIQYEYDSDIHGTDEYWQFPLETLFLGTGDCEDTSILFAAIGKQMGWDMALFLLSGHMAAGLALDSFTDQTPGYSMYLSSKNSFTSDDYEVYYYCETTGASSSYHVGDMPSGQTLYKVMPVGVMSA